MFIIQSARVPNKTNVAKRHSNPIKKAKTGYTLNGIIGSVSTSLTIADGRSITFYLLYDSMHEMISQNRKHVFEKSRLIRHPAETDWLG